MSTAPCTGDLAGSLIDDLEKVRANGSADDIHQLRIAILRFRTFLRLSIMPWEPKRAHRLEAELDWLRHRFAPVRDADMFMEMCGKRAAEFGCSAAVEQINGAADAHRKAAFGKAKTSLKSQRCIRLIEDLRVFVRKKPHLNSASGRCAVDCALEHEYAEVRKHGRRIGDQHLSDLHRLRRKIKALRYMGDRVAAAYDPIQVGHFLDALNELQRRLGSIQDLVVIRSIANALGKDEESAAKKLLRCIAKGAKSESIHRRQHLHTAWRTFKRSPRFWRQSEAMPAVLPGEAGTTR